MDFWLEVLFWGGFVGGGGAFAIFCFVMAILQYKQAKANPTPSIAEQEDTFSPNYVTFRATVTNQACCVRAVGIKTPKTVRIFTIEFQTEDGETLRLNVPEEAYDGFEIGQVGELTTVDGELYSFVLNNDISN